MVSNQRSDVLQMLVRMVGHKTYRQNQRGESGRQVVWRVGDVDLGVSPKLTVYYT
jgi:hypothetical protein